MYKGIETERLNVDRLFSRAEVTRILGLGLSKVDQLIATGELYSIQYGARRVIPGWALVPLIWPGTEVKPPHGPKREENE